jgi:hypothetical protein
LPLFSRQSSKNSIYFNNRGQIAAKKLFEVEEKIQDGGLCIKNIKSS